MRYNNVLRHSRPFGCTHARRGTELQFTLPGRWSVTLFVAVCRKHGVRPYRHARQRRTTVMVRARERAFQRVVWPEFSRLQTELKIYFHDVDRPPDHARDGFGRR